ncbi:hypothetical protein MPSEU_000880700 [Mayamaea pseudoterrestris]|nr:hypothetical protein MPSEU_000880700 [Mayamaea pseudoterrestris]
MKLPYSAILFVLASIATPSSHAFTTSTSFHSSTTKVATSSRLAPTRLSVVDESSSSVGMDVSIPYDAPARLAYKEWCSKFNQTPDESRYQNFRNNYETITVANISAKKQARDKNDSPGPELTLNEYGDCTEAEYQELMSSKSQGTTKPMSTGDVLGKAVEAAQSQSAASEALAEAADALAEEERLLVEKLGLESVEELEAAVDSMQGIDEDGLEVSDSLAREARIRSAYLDWCKQFEKKPSEERFPSFSKNFLVMEDFAKESGKEIKLNEYADCTEEEYDAMSSKSNVATSPAPTPAPRKAVASADINEAESRRREAETTAKKQAELQSRAEKERKQNQEVEAARQKELEAKRIKLKEWQGKTAEERRAANEKERQSRQKEQEAKLAKQLADEEAKVIAAANAQAAKDAALAAQRRAFDEQAAEIARKKAREWEEKQQQLARSKSRVPEPAKKSLFSAFQSLKVEPTAQKAEAPKVEIELSLPNFRAPSTNPKEKKKPMLDFSALNGLIPKELTGRPAPAPALKRSAPLVKQPAATTNSFLSTPEVVKRSVKPVESKPLTVPSKIDVSDPVTEAFASIFGGLKKESVSKQKLSTPVPSPTPAKKVNSPGLSFFSPKSAPSSGSSPVTAPAPAPAKKPSAPTMSFFSPPALKSKALTSKPAAAPAKKQTGQSFSFFSPANRKLKQAPAPSPKPAPRPSKPTFPFFNAPVPDAKQASISAPTPAKKSAFSIFGGKVSNAKSLAMPASTKSPPKLSNKQGTLSIFGNASKPQLKPETPAPAPARPTLSLFGGGKTQGSKSAGPPPGVPELSRWKQNANGSITGRIRGSKNFKDGEEVTTSAVSRGAKAGSIVKTGSGSRYYLS